MAIDSATRKMLNGDKNAIIDGFISSSMVDNFNAIVCAVKYHLRGKAIEGQLVRLSRDDTCLFGQNAGYRISDVAVAALHLLGISEYDGTEENVLALIDSKLNFYE